jgi:hypothetical protein
LQLPPLYSAESRYGNSLTVRPASQGHPCIREAPRQPLPAECHYRIGDRQCDRACARTRPGSPGTPSRVSQRIHDQRVFPHHEARTGALRDGSMSRNGEHGGDLAGRPAHRQPIQGARQPGPHQQQYQACQGDHHGHLEEGETLPHSPKCRPPGPDARSVYCGIRQEILDFCTLTSRGPERYVGSLSGVA